MKRIVLIGAGGHSKVIIDIIKSRNEYDIVGITDKFNRENVLNIPIIGDDNILDKLYNDDVKYAFICIGALGNMSVRNVIYNKLKNIGFKLPVLIHKSAIVSNYVNIDEGTCVMPGAIINPEVHIGKSCIINTGSIIEHDCIIGDNVHISPGVKLAGGVKIGNNSHVGIGSSIIQNKVIGNNVTIGAGAVVIKNIANDSVAVGVPTKIVKIKKS
jgi:UDP-perosamine 4-acetyltransferase